MASWQRDYLRYKSFFLDILRVYRERPDFRAYLELVLSLVAITIFSAFAIRPTILTILELNKEINTKEDTLAKLNTKITNLQSANEELVAVSEDLTYVKQAVPSLAEPEQFIRQIEGLTSKHSVSILGLSASDVVLLGSAGSVKRSKETVELPRNASEVPITLSVTASYPSLLSFLKDLENLRRPIKIDSLSFNSTQTDEVKKIILVISGRTPYLNQ